MLWRPFFARDKINYRRMYSCILRRAHAAAMATELVKNKAQIIVFVYLKEIQSLDCFHLLHTTS